MRYAAFISYSHRDRRWAEWLHRRIESYRPPRDLNLDAGVAALRPVFLDRAELSSSARPGRHGAHRAGTVRCARRRLLARWAQSRWVNEEVRYFKSLGKAAHLLPRRRR